MADYPNSYAMLPMGIPMDYYRNPETLELIAVAHRCDGTNCRYADMGRPCNPDDNPAGSFKDDDK
jgi:hypothetical protein